MGEQLSLSRNLGCRALASDKNGKVLEEILSSDLDLVVLNDHSHTYFQFKSDYSELLDLFICSSRLANSMSHFEVLTDYLMESDHAPIMCVLDLKKDFRIDVGSPSRGLTSTKQTGIDMVKY